jgi:hypothetical protein
VTIHAIRAVLVFRVPNGVTLTANGKGVRSNEGQAVIDVGNAAVVDWKLQSDTYSYADQVLIARPAVSGMGAFTIAALPVSIIYEPPQNAARTNHATVEFTSESTVIETITNGSGSMTNPRWAGEEAALMVGKLMASRTPVTSAAWAPITAVISALSSQPEVTSGIEVNTDHTLSLTMSEHEAITTHAHSGPGHGDLIAFYRDARVMWGMDAGNVTLTLLDTAGLSILTVDQLRADRAALTSGGTAVSGLDRQSLAALIALDPMSRSSQTLVESVLSAPKLRASRFIKKRPVQINGSTYANKLTHVITTSDTRSKLQTTTTVTDSHGGWLTLLGIGSQTAGTTTTKVSLGASRTTSSTRTKSSSFMLDAGPGETYTVDVYYDNVFGTFLLRLPSSGAIDTNKPAPPSPSPPKHPEAPAKKGVWPFNPKHDTP